MTDTSKTPAISSKKEKSYAITVRALEKIDQVGLPSSPQFYELWYRYFDGDPEIVRAINTHQGPLDEAACPSEDRIARQAAAQLPCSTMWSATL